MPKEKYDPNGQPQPLVDVPEISQLRNNELGREVFRLVNERFEGNNYVKQDISYLENNQPIEHLNPYRRWAIGPAIRELMPDAQLISPAISEIALKYDKLPKISGTKEVLALVVYSLKGKNDKLAQYIVNQAKEVGIKIKFPMVFYHLETVKDDKFPDGLRFDLSEIAVAYHVPILSKRAHYFDADDPELIKSGFPSEVKKGYKTLKNPRVLSTSVEDGLTFLCRYKNDWKFILGVHGIALGSGGEDKWASFVKGVIPQNLEDALAGIEGERGRQEELVKTRHERALEVMGK